MSPVGTRGLTLVVRQIKTMRHMGLLRQYSLVRFRFEQLPVEYHSKYPFTPDGVYVFFGEIPNMPGHCVVANRSTGQLHCGYHSENFEELSDDQL